MIINGDSAKELKKFKDNSIDAVITDPPYGIEFLAKEWDNNTGAVEIWQECLRVLKPGGFLLAFSAARTYHILATNIQSAGFEIRDQIMWLYASGFPKAQDIGKAIDRRAGKKDKNYGSSQGKGGEVFEQFNHPLCNKCGKGISYEAKCKDQDCGMRYKYQTAEALKWSGWKTALKPAHEPICMARKPFKGSAVDNVLEHGTGALNIDATRIPAEQDLIDWYTRYPEQKSKDGVYENYNPEVSVRRKNTQPVDTTEIQGRFPSNVIGEVEGYQKYFYKPKSDHEPICMARKPMKGSTIDNVLEHGVGALNIDATRIPSTPERIAEVRKINAEGGLVAGDGIEKYSTIGGPNQSLDRRSKLAESRYPSNVIGEVEGYQKYFYCPKVSRKERHRGFEQKSVISSEEMAHHMGGYLKSNNHVWTPDLGDFYIHGLKHEYEQWCKKKNKDPLSHIPTNPDGMYAKDENGEYKVKGRNYMYIAEQQRTKKDPLSHIPSQFPRSEVPGGEGKKMLNKMVEVNKKDPLSQDINPKDGLPKRICNEGGGDDWAHNPKVAERMNVGNNHPTVKPVELMKYLIKLVAPQGSHILDPFAGSGSTGMAAKEMGYKFTGIEMDANYVDICIRRIEATKTDPKHTLFK